jgi:hypothetical protein
VAKNIILQDDRKRSGKRSNKVDHRVINNHDFYFDVDEENSGILEIKNHEFPSLDLSKSRSKVQFTQNALNKNPKERTINMSDLYEKSDKLLNMATTSEKSYKKDINPGIDINMVLSQKTNKASGNTRKLHMQCSEMTPLDFLDDPPVYENHKHEILAMDTEDPPIGSYEVNSHAWKGKKSLEQMIMETFSDEEDDKEQGNFNKTLPSAISRPTTTYPSSTLRTMRPVQNEVV